MRCGDCPRGRFFAEGSVYCVLYGIIIRADHICRLPGGEKDGGTEDHRQGGEDETELQKDGGGNAEAVPGVLPGSGERAEVSGVEGREG